MYFSICDNVSIRDYKLKGNKSILIRILEPSYKLDGIPYTIDNIKQYKDVLELYIDDTIVVDKNINNENTFDYQKAEILNNFILKNDFDEVVIHCSLGISRSPAVMICIAKILNNSELENIIKENYKFYNLYLVDTFIKTKYSIKNIDDNKIDGNILSEKYDSEVDYVLKKMLK